MDCMSTSNASVACCCSSFCGAADCVVTFAFWDGITVACKSMWDDEHMAFEDDFNRSECESWEDNHRC